MAEKREWETAAHGDDGYVRKDAPLVLFRGALDHAEAEVILTQALLQRQLTEEPEPREKAEALVGYLQELLELLRAVMTAEYRGTPLVVETLFGYTLDELQERSHNAEQFYGVPTMTRPDFKYGETYARLNLLRTELRKVETTAVRLLVNDAGETARPDLLHILNRLSSAAHVLMCWWISEK
ncbi:MAG: hypothetical protein IJ547_00795 [Clostridia bacterium]|nr:hypothetical protein [Clostridia bacterium]